MTSSPRYKVKKINRHLVITDTDVPIYHMPNWIRISSRSDLQKLADAFNEKDERDISAIMEFESTYSIKNITKKY